MNTHHQVPPPAGCPLYFFYFLHHLFPREENKKNRVGSPVVPWVVEMGTADRQPEGILDHISWQERSAVARRTEQQA
jgi:hypothetical protein